MGAFYRHPVYSRRYHELYGQLPPPLQTQSMPIVVDPFISANGMTPTILPGPSFADPVTPLFTPIPSTVPTIAAPAENVAASAIAMSLAAEAQFEDDIRKIRHGMTETINTGVRHDAEEEFDTFRHLRSSSRGSKSGENKEYIDKDRDDSLGPLALKDKKSATTSITFSIPPLAKQIVRGSQEPSITNHHHSTTSHIVDNTRTNNDITKVPSQRRPSDNKSRSISRKGSDSPRISRSRSISR